MTFNSTLKILAFALVGLQACNQGNKTVDTNDSLNYVDADTNTVFNSAHADIAATKSDTAGNGTADFTRQDNGMVKMKLALNFPAKANQTVAVHFHEHGDCGDQGGGAHGHWNPTNEKHGKWGSNEYHSGDIGNIELNANGKAEINLESDRWSIGGDSTKNILNRAIIVHSGVDDYTTQPTGNSGSRIGCGVIKGTN